MTDMDDEPGPTRPSGCPPPCFPADTRALSSARASQNARWVIKLSRLQYYQRSEHQSSHVPHSQSYLTEQDAYQKCKTTVQYLSFQMIATALAEVRLSKVNATFRMLQPIDATDLRMAGLTSLIRDVLQMQSSR